MYVSLFSLWLPILLATLLAWIASMLIHMLLKYHNHDYGKLSNEEAVMSSVRDGKPASGFYAFPNVMDMKDFQDESVQAKFKNGPVGFLIIGDNGLPAMGKLVAQQISFFFVGIVIIAYCASLALDPIASYLEVFRLVMTVSFLTFSWATIPYSIWFGIPWAMAARYFLDALVYSAVVAGSFAGFWPVPM